MERNLVQVARIRAREVVLADVVNRLADEQKGWFAVGLIENLFDGTIAFSSEDRKMTFTTSPLDLVGVQTLKPMNIEVTEMLDEDTGDDESESSEEATGERPAGDAPAPTDSEVVQPVSERPIAEPTADPAKAVEADRARQALLTRMGQ